MFFLEITNITTILSFHLHVFSFSRSTLWSLLGITYHCPIPHPLINVIRLQHGSVHDTDTDTQYTILSDTVCGVGGLNG